MTVLLMTSCLPLCLVSLHKTSIFIVHLELLICYFSFSVFKPDNKPLVVRGTLGDVFETPSRKGLRVKRPKKLISDVPPAAVPPLESNLNLPTQAGLTASK